MNDPRLHELLAGRWSPSAFDPSHELSEAELDTLLAAARWAPSWGNMQPWSLIVLQRGGPGHDVLVAQLRRGNLGWVPRASAVLIATVPTSFDGPGDPSSPWYDVGQASAHVTLQARAMRLEAHQFGGFDHEAVAEGLGVPSDRAVVAGIAVGRHAPQTVDASTEDGARLLEREARERRRKPTSEIAHLGRWGTPWTPDAD